jgi:hypothetical protein
VDCDTVFNCLKTTSTTTTAAPFCTTWNWEAAGANSSALIYVDCDGVETTIPIIDVTDSSGSICVLSPNIPYWSPDPSEGYHQLATYSEQCSPACFSYDITIAQEYLDLSDGGEIVVSWDSCPEGKSESMSYTVAGAYPDALCSVDPASISGFYYVGENEFTFPVFPVESINPCTTTTTTTTTFQQCMSYTLTAPNSSEFRWIGQICGENVIITGVITDTVPVDIGCLVVGSLIVDDGLIITENEECSGVTCHNFILEGVSIPFGSYTAVDCEGNFISGDINSGVDLELGCVLPVTLVLDGVTIKQDLGQCTTTTTTTIVCEFCDEWKWTSSGRNFSNLVYQDCTEGYQIILRANITDNNDIICVRKGTVPFWVPAPSLTDQITLHTLKLNGCCTS